jgi:hypothetical protein
MRVTRSFDTSVYEGPKAFALASRAIEKASASSTLSREKPRADQPSEKSTPRLQVELVCQDETPRFDPFWDAPRLLPTFVTQVLGQVMPERRASASVETAYGSAPCPRKALVLDRRS